MVLDWPVGTPEERVQYDKLPGAWLDATGYGVRYSATGAWAVHTGLDMNLNVPKYDSDKDSPVYAAGDGLVGFAGKLPVWGMVITIKHEDALWTRYAHGENLRVQQGQVVKKGDLLCQVGNADGRYPYHLHYDLARIDLTAKPGDWPGDNLQRVLRDYINPVDYMHNQVLEADASCPRVVRVTAEPVLNVRDKPDVKSAKVGTLPTKTLAYVRAESADKLWLHINLPLTGWIMAQWTEAVQ